MAMTLLDKLAFAADTVEDGELSILLTDAAAWIQTFGDFATEQEARELGEQRWTLADPEPMTAADRIEETFSRR